MAEPLISICIPAYERLDYLKRLIESIKMQTFKDFEVIVTDDSKTDKVEQFIKSYDANFPLHYYRNPISLGTSKNMIAGMKYARSSWIKIIHDDDWLTDENSMSGFAEYAKNEYRVVYSGYIAYEESTDKSTDKTLTLPAFDKVSKNPYFLLSNNLIGVPSVSMFRTDETILYDERFNWLTDIECYIRCFEAYGTQNAYITKPLLTICFNASQLTSSLSRNPKVVIHDFLLFYSKHRGNGLKNIMVYDTWWRMVRNFKIRSIKDLESYADHPVPQFLKNIVRLQSSIPQKLLANKVVSKLSMSISYLLNNKS
jgi:glycosyltransferase involved in cell wall biosynthesis